MKKYALFILCGIIILASVILPSFTYNIKNIEIAKALNNKDIYQQGDILILVYQVNCKNGIGGFNFEVKYDGDNLNFYNVSAGEDYSIVSRDDSVGTVEVGVMSNIADESHTADKSVKVAVSFEALYMLDASYITFEQNMKNFSDARINLSEDYSVSESFYIYDTQDMEYDEYVKSILETKDTDPERNSDFDSEIDTDTNSDTETDTDSETDSDTETDTDSETDSDTETDTDSEIDSDTETDTDSEIDSDTESDIEPVSYIYGDVDSDGEITSVDSLLVLRYSVKLEDFSPLLVKLSDVDGDGEVTSNDSLEILRYSVGLDCESEVGIETVI